MPKVKQQLVYFVTCSVSLYVAFTFISLHSLSTSGSTSTSLLPDEKHWVGAIPQYINILVNVITHAD